MELAEQFLGKLRSFVIGNKLIKSGDTVLVAFSGGSDSTALIHSLLALRRELYLNLIAAHVNYHLRGEESEGDMQFVKGFCSRNSISLVIKNVTMHTSSDLENEARRIRFDFFDSLVSMYRVNRIALGHNKNDVVETMLLHLFRGSGITGMKGIVPSNGRVIRPLLCFEKEEIIEYLKAVGIEDWRSDSSNTENYFTRNRVRNKLIPWLEENINRRVIDLLYQNSVIFKESDEYLRDSAVKVLKKAIVNQTVKEIRLEISNIEHKSPIILFYVFKEIIGILISKETGFYHNHLKEICSILPSKGSKMLRLPNGIIVRKEYHEIVFTIEEMIETSGESYEKISQIFDINKKHHLFGNKRIVCKRVNRKEVKRKDFKDDYTALIDLDKLSLPLEIGYRKKGDRFVPIGMTGTKKLKDFFIDEKINKFERDKVLVFRDREKIVWVAGLRIDDRVKIEEHTQSVLLIKIEEIRARSRKSILRRKPQASKTG